MAHRAHGGALPVAGTPTAGSPDADRSAPGLPSGLRTCLEQEIENLRRLLRYRDLERKFADQLRAVDEAVQAALEEGSRTLSLAALRAIGALTMEVNREPSKRAGPGADHAGRA